MYAPPEESVNNCDNDSDESNVEEEDEDELTRIISPEGIHVFMYEDLN